MDYMSNFVHNIVVAPIQYAIKLYHLCIQSSNPSDQVSAVLVELFLDPLISDELLLVRLRVDDLTIIIMDLGLSLARHR